MSNTTPSASIQASGYVSRTGEVREVVGNKVFNFSLPYAPFRSNGDVNWIACEVWGKRAEAAARFLTKGTFVSVHGTLKINKYTSKTGELVTSVTIQVTEFSFVNRVGSKADAEVTERIRREKEQETDADFAGTGDGDDNLDGWG